jgi:K+-transporting ATPase KdpF subunit
MGLAADRQQQRMLAVTTADRAGAMLSAVAAVAGEERHGHRCGPSRAGRVRADVRPREGDGADMSGADIVGLVIALVVFGYLVFALMRGERL